MKAFKIAGIVIIAVGLIVLIGGFMFLKTLDVNKYVPVIAEQVKKATGRDLKISRADLKVSLWHGISLEVSGVSLSDDRRFSDQAFLSVDKVLLGLSLKPLILERKIQIADVTVVAPRVNIIRNKEGLINAAMMGVSSGSQPQGAQKSGSQKMAALPAILVDRIQVKDASITYIDDTFNPGMALTVDRLEFALKDFSFTEIFTFELTAAMFSADPDLEIRGKARIALDSFSVWVTDTRLNLDLAKISTSKLNAMLPMVGPAGLKDPLKGQVVVSVSELRAGVSGLQALKMSGDLTGGQVGLSLIPLPLEDISLAFDADAKDLVVKSCSFRLAEGTVDVAGTVRGYMSSPVVELTGRGADISLGKIFDAYKLSVKITGKANTDMKLSFSGKTLEEIAATWKVELSTSVKDGALEGINFVQAGLGNIPMLPALWDMVQPSLPPETQDDLKNGVTVIESADVLIHMDGMTATVDRAEIVTRDVTASAKGMAKVPETVDLSVDLYFQKKLADALIKKVTDLAGLQDEQGKMYIPLKITGPLAAPKTMPDVDYLSKKLFLNRGKEELQKVIEKNPEVQGVLNAIFGVPKSESTPQEGAPVPNDPAGGAPAPDSKAEAAQAVDAIFNSLFKKK